MRAIVYKKPNSVSVESVPDPKIEAPTDAVVRITSAGICGSDLHRDGNAGVVAQLGDLGRLGTVPVTSPSLERRS
jgi:threonine dehydrogenase-like Zn-dependent dehydrogenase